MAKKLARMALTILGVVLGIALANVCNQLMLDSGYQGIWQVFLPWAVVLIYAAVGTISGIIFFIISPRLINGFKKLIASIEERLSDMTLSDIFFSAMGLVIGLVIAYLLTGITRTIGMAPIELVVNIILYFVLGCLGWVVVIKRRGEINVPELFKRSGKDKTTKSSKAARPKILDTSAIIDGRIADICETGILEGILIVPGFVLDELRHIADSSDSLKRNRGRRGLELLNDMQNSMRVSIKIIDTDYENIAEVDAKLIRLASDMDGVIVTNDYNLNKAASVQRVAVFNINDLSNAVKPLMLAGEELEVFVTKEGKEQNQGVAYLDDGTMIVIDGGRRMVGERATVNVTSVLQTSAGRMIFAKLNE